MLAATANALQRKCHDAALIRLARRRCDALFATLRDKAPHRPRPVPALTITITIMMELDLDDLTTAVTARGAQWRHPVAAALRVEPVHVVFFLG